MTILIQSQQRTRRHLGAQCFHCLEPILPGERYQDERYTDNGRAYRLMTHDYCAAWFDAACRARHFDDPGGIGEGMLVELLDDIRDDLEWRAEQEVRRGR
jgi:hypothetical protein